MQLSFITTAISFQLAGYQLISASCGGDTKTPRPSWQAEERAGRHPGQNCRPRSQNRRPGRSRPATPVSVMNAKPESFKSYLEVQGRVDFDQNATVGSPRRRLAHQHPRAARRPGAQGPGAGHHRCQHSRCQRRRAAHPHGPGPHRVREAEGPLGPADWHRNPVPAGQQQLPGPAAQPGHPQPAARPLQRGGPLRGHRGRGAAQAGRNHGARRAGGAPDQRHGRQNPGRRSRKPTATASRPATKPW